MKKQTINEKIRHTERVKEKENEEKYKNIRKTTIFH